MQMDDAMQAAHRLHAYATGVQDLLRETESRLSTVEGTDPRGAVRVRLGPGGAPAAITVASDWKRKLPAVQLAAAVAKAAAAASHNRQLRWVQAVADSDWTNRLDALGREDGIVAPAPGGRADAPLANPREFLRNALDATHASEPLRGSGSVDSGRLVLTVTAGGGLSCTADPDWVSQLSALDLTEALNTALTAAQADLAGTEER